MGWYIDDVEVTDVILGGTCTTLSACTAPGAPILTSATGTLCGVIDLAWTAGAGTTGSYNVYRSVFSGGPYQKINGAPVTGLTYSDTTAAPNTTYYYVVRGACDAFGVYESVQQQPAFRHLRRIHGPRRSRSPELFEYRRHFGRG